MVVEPMWRRVIMKDSFGNNITTSNPLPVDATLIGATVYTVPPFTVSAAVTGDQTALILISPPAGRQLQCIGCMVNGESAVFNVKIWFPTSGVVIQQHFENGTLGTYIPTNLKGLVDESIVLDITGSIPTDNWFVIVNYALVPI